MGGSLAKPESILETVHYYEHRGLLPNATMSCESSRVPEKLCWCAVRSEPISAIAGSFNTAPALFFFPHQRSESDADQQSFG
jgi:hypothetical protein